MKASLHESSPKILPTTIRNLNPLHMNQELKIHFKVQIKRFHKSLKQKAPHCISPLKKSHNPKNLLTKLFKF